LRATASVAAMPVETMPMGLRTPRFAAERAERVVLPASNGHRVFLGALAVMQPTGPGLVRGKSINGKTYNRGAEKSFHGL
jgi:hypothetical protein